MGRHNSIQSASTELQIAWFKWEFLRRNENYQRDYAEFERRFGAWFKKNGYWWAKNDPPYTTDAWFFFCSQIAPAAKKICQRWGVSRPYNPAWIFDVNGIRQEQRNRVRLPRFFSNPQGADIWDLKVLDPALFPSEEDRRNEMRKAIPRTIEPEPWRVTNEKRLIRLEIDITKPLDRIFDEVAEEVDFERRRYEVQVGPLPDHRQKPRARLDQYETCLRVWHLRQSRTTFTQIAQELFPKEMENADRLSPEIKRVRSQYNRACKLIEGGYRHIEV